MDEQNLADAAERLSRTLTPDDLEETLRRITSAAVACVAGVDHASITVRHPDGRLESVAPTDEVVAELDAEQFALQEGPCYEAAVHADQVVTDDFAVDSRFPSYAQAAKAAGVQAQAGLRLFTLDGRSGALNLYSRRSGTFADLTEVTELFDRESAAAESQARELEAVRAAAREAQLVGRAVGISMERYGFTQHGAFAFLTRLADRQQVPTPRVAEAIIAAGERRAD